MGLDVSFYNPTNGACVIDKHITHNLKSMAMEAGVYGPLWRHQELDIVTASDLIPYLEKAIAVLQADPEHFKQFDAENGWGIYDDFLPWLQDLLQQCRQWPDSLMRAHR